MLYLSFILRGTELPNLYGIVIKIKTFIDKIGIARYMTFYNLGSPTSSIHNEDRVGFIILRKNIRVLDTV